MEEESSGRSRPGKGVRRGLHVPASSATGVLTDAQWDRLEFIQRNQGETPLWKWLVKKKRPARLTDALDLITQCIELGWADVLHSYLSEPRERQTVFGLKADLVLKSRGVTRDVDKKAVIQACNVLLRWLQKVPMRLRTLWIEGLPISCTELCKTLRLCDTVSDLRVIDAGLDDKQAKELSEGLAANRTLRRLTLHGCKFESAASAAALVQAILKHPALEAIELSNCGFSKTSSDALKRLLASTRLIAIDLSRNSFADSGAKFLAGLKGNNTLQWLTLNACGLDDVAEKMLVEILPQSKITHLCLEQNKLRPVFASASKTLTWLSVAKCTADNMASGIQDIEKSKSLKYLSLAGIDLGFSKSGRPDAVEALVRLIAAATPLAHLALRGCGIRKTADLERVLGAATLSRALQTLDLANNFSMVTEEVKFDSLANNESLIELDLSGNHFAPAAQEKLWTSLAGNSTLKVLKLANTPIDFHSGAFAKWIGSKASVHTLDLSGIQYEFNQLLPVLAGVADKTSVIENLSLDVVRKTKDQQMLAQSLIKAVEGNDKLVHVQTNLPGDQIWNQFYIGALRKNLQVSMASLESCKSLVRRLLAEWQHPGDVPVVPDDACEVIWSYLSGSPGGDAEDAKMQTVRLSLKLRLINRRLSGLSPLPAVLPPPSSKVAALTYWDDLPLPDLPDSDEESESSD